MTLPGLVVGVVVGLLGGFAFAEWVDNRRYTGRWWPWTKRKRGEWR